MRAWDILPLASLALLAACVLPANVVVNLPGDEGQSGAVIVSNASGNTELTRPLAAVGLEPGAPPGRQFVTDPQAIGQVFGEVLKATPPKPVSFTIAFEPKSKEFVPASAADLARAADAAKTMSYPEITVIEYDDPASPVGPNDALLTARAQSVLDMLVRAGISRSSVDIVYYGSALSRSEHSKVLQPDAPIEVTIR